jgi:hypothetical protein
MFGATLVQDQQLLIRAARLTEKWKRLDREENNLGRHWSGNRMPSSECVKPEAAQLAPQ